MIGFNGQNATPVEAASNFDASKNKNIRNGIRNGKIDAQLSSHK